MNFSTNFAAHPPVRTQRWWNSTGMDRKVHSFGTEVWPGLLIACSSRESKGKGTEKKTVLYRLLKIVPVIGI